MEDVRWRTWMTAAQGGDAAAYRLLLTDLRPWLTRYYVRRLPNGAADDAVQDALVAIHTKRHTYDPARPFGPWLAAVARHKWIDRLRTMRRQAETGLPEDLSTGDHEAAVTSANLLGRLLETLKPAQAEAIRLVKLQGFSVEEASSLTGQATSLIKVNIHRGLARLARTLAERDDDAQ